jgi:hypothetical protein
LPLVKSERTTNTEGTTENDVAMKRIIRTVLRIIVANGFLHRASAAALVSTTPAQDILNNFG